MLGGIGGRRKRGDRGWNGWMASPTLWTWVWVNSGSWWWTGRPGVLWFMGLQRVGHDWATEPNWTELNFWITTENQRDNSYDNKTSSYWNFSVTSVKCTASKTWYWPKLFFSPSPHIQFIMLIIFLWNVFWFVCNSHFLLTQVLLDSNLKY